MILFYKVKRLLQSKDVSEVRRRSCKFGSIGAHRGNLTALRAPRCKTRNNIHLQLLQLRVHVTKSKKTSTRKASRGIERSTAAKHLDEYNVIGQIQTEPVRI